MLRQGVNKQHSKLALVDNFWEQKTLQHAVTIKQLKVLIWIYFYLLIFEGALRKWFLPGLATPLLIIRDPIALWALVIAWNKGILKANVYVTSILVIGVISFITAVTLGHGNAFVAFFGLRIYLIHFPFMFVVGNVFNLHDVIKLGKITLALSIFMGVLIALQFFSPQSAWVNRGVGGDETGAGFAGALGYARPPGTFSFTSGNTMFFSLVGAFVFYFWLNHKSANKLLLILASLALLAAIPLSISRSLFFTIIITAFFSIICSAAKPGLFKNIIVAIVGIGIALLLLSQTVFFQTATAAFNSRLETATESEGGVQGVLIDRYLGGLAGAFLNAYQYPFFGFGIGLGTNAGGMLLTGKAARVIAEGDWGRIVGEQGLLIGLITIMIRIVFSGDIMLKSFKNIKNNNFLPWLLISFGLTIIPQGQWGQPTTLGFSTIAGGLILASLNNDNKFY